MGAQTTRDNHRTAISLVVLVAILLVATLAAAFSGIGQTRTISGSSNESTSTGGVSSSSLAQEWNLNITGFAYPPNFVSFNPSTGEIYVSGWGGSSSNEVTVVDSNTHEVSGDFSIPGTTYVGPITVDSQTGNLLAPADVCEGEPLATSETCPPGNVHLVLFELNGSTKAVTRQFSLGSGFPFATNLVMGRLYALQTCPNPNGVAMNPDFPNCGFLNVYDLESGSLLANISLSAPPYGIAIDSETSMIYVIVGLPNSQEFLIINGTDNQLISQAPFETVSTPVLQVDTTTGTVFSLAVNGSPVNGTSTVITAIDGSNGKILYSNPIGSSCSVDSNRYYVNSFTNQIYASASNESLGTNYFLVINASQGSLVNMISTSGNVYEDSTFNPQLGQVYLLAGDQLMAFPAETASTYVNPSLLTHSSCFDFPA